MPYYSIDSIKADERHHRTREVFGRSEKILDGKDRGAVSHMDESFYTAEMVPNWHDDYNVTSLPLGSLQCRSH